MRVRIVGILRKRGLSLRYCRSMLLFVEEDLRSSLCGPTHRPAEGPKASRRLLRAREVACGVVAPLIGHPISQSAR